VSVTIRRGRPGDLAALTELYNVYVRETPVTFDIEAYTIETRRPWFDAFGESGRHQLFVVIPVGSVLSGSLKVGERFRTLRPAEGTA
jgi:phosphinothricin acetyltransferase